jgi:hypothetical protein
MARLNSQVLGAVLGDVLGEYLDGDEMVGARHHGRHRPHLLALPPKPGWRQGIITPGVNGPSEGKVPLPLTPDGGTGSFTATSATVINFRARPQQPFHPQRLLAQVLRSGASAAGLAAVCQGAFVGVGLQQAQLGAFNIEFFGATAFDVMLNMQPAEPGIDVTFPINLTGTPAGADFVNVQLLILGANLR